MTIHYDPTNTIPTTTSDRQIPRWVAPVGLLTATAAALVGIALVRGDSTATVNQPVRPPVVADRLVDAGAGAAVTPAYKQVQDAIDAALAERATSTSDSAAPAYKQVQDAIDVALAERAASANTTSVSPSSGLPVVADRLVPPSAGTASVTPAYKQVQDAIDAALAERVVESSGSVTSSYTLVQDAIDAALAEHTSGSETVPAHDQGRVR